MSGKCQALLLKNAGRHECTNKFETTAHTMLKFLQTLPNRFICFYIMHTKHRTCSICWLCTWPYAELWIIFPGKTGFLSKCFVCQGDSGTLRNKVSSFVWNIFHCGDFTEYEDVQFLNLFGVNSFAVMSLRCQNWQITHFPLLLPKAIRGFERCIIPSLNEMIMKILFHFSMEIKFAAEILLRCWIESALYIAC